MYTALQLLGAGRDAVILEHLSRGAFVAHVTVTDEDAAADNGRVTCDVTSRDSAFQLVPHHHNEYLASYPSLAT